MTAIPASRPSPARERILSAAHDLFYRDGIRATGIDRVIAASGVTKATFYRHFPSKHDLVRAFLEHRHRRWMDWFRAALDANGGDAAALAPALGEWLRDPGFRGCAFINSVGELAGELPEVRDIARRHKQEMEDAIAKLLPASRRRRQLARDLAVAVDGAIIRAQFEADADAALDSFERLRRALTGAG